MGRRVVSARDQVEMLSPWHEAVHAALQQRPGRPGEAPTHHRDLFELWERPRGLSDDFDPFDDLHEGRYASSVNREYSHLPRDERGRVLLHRGVDEGFNHITYHNTPDPTGRTQNPFHFTPPAHWDEAMSNLRAEQGGEGVGSYWGTPEEARFYAGDANGREPHGAMTVGAWWNPEDISDTEDWQDGVWVRPGAQGEIDQAHVYHEGKGWVPLPGSPKRTVTAGPRRRFNQEWQHVGGDYFPLDVITHYMDRKGQGFGDEKAELYQSQGQPPLSQQIDQSGYEKPVELCTDGKSGCVYDGHHRIDVARQLGHTHVPVQVTWRVPDPVWGAEGAYGNKIEPWLKKWLTDMRGGRETVGRIAPLANRSLLDLFHQAARYQGEPS